MLNTMKPQRLSILLRTQRLIAVFLVLFMGFGHALRNPQSGVIDFSLATNLACGMSANQHHHSSQHSNQHPNQHNDHTQHCPMCGNAALSDAALEIFTAKPTNTIAVLENFYFTPVLVQPKNLSAGARAPPAFIF